MDDAKFGFFNRIFSELDTALGVYVSDVVAGVIGSLGSVTAQLLVLYFIIHGFMMMRGMIEEPVTDFAWRVARLSIITGIALNVGYYNSAVVDFIWRFPEALAALVVQGGGWFGICVISRWPNVADVFARDCVLGQGYCFDYPTCWIDSLCYCGLGCWLGSDGLRGISLVFV